VRYNTGNAGCGECIAVPEGRFVAYYRVSTAEQGRSGLGLEAQRAAVEAYLNGGSWELAAEFTEVESGKRADRPELAKALDRCRLIGATLVIAKLDRLTRNVAFMANLMESGAEFVAVDNPHATKFTIHILAAVAEHEREQISSRTKAALAAAKARGKRLGGYRGNPPPDASLGAAARRDAADAFAARVRPTIVALRARGLSLRRIAAELTAAGVRTADGGVWAATTVGRALARGEPADRSEGRPRCAPGAVRAPGPPPRPRSGGCRRPVDAPPSPPLGGRNRAQRKVPSPRHRPALVEGQHHRARLADDGREAAAEDHRRPARSPR
jgi:DNA invertase Pin-like site-specific DNA recombinase